MKVYLLQKEHSEYNNMYQTVSADSDKPLIFSKYSCGGYLEFRGNVCEVSGFIPGKWCTLMPSTKFPRTVFAIDDYEEGQFILYVFQGKSFILDQTLGIKLPNYVKDELIATIQDYN